LDFGSLVETGEINAVRSIHRRARVLLRVLALVDLIERETLNDVKAVRRLDQRRTDLTRLERGDAIREWRHHRPLLVHTQTAARTLAARLTAVLLVELSKVDVGDRRQYRCCLLAHRVLFRPRP